MSLKKYIKKILNEEINYLIESELNDCNMIKATDWKSLYQNLVNQGSVKKGQPMIIVWGPSQIGYYTPDGETIAKQFLVSTGKNGFSNNVDNKETPTGLMVTTNKIVAPSKYQVLVGKRPIDMILGPNKDSTRVDDEGKKHFAEVLTGLLELSGLEKCNQNVRERNIYFHGTNKENQLGSKRSAGCIRVSNDTILWLTSNIKKGTKVYVKPD